MDLLPDNVRGTLPPIGSQAEDPDPKLLVKFFTPDAGWTWYASEGEPVGDDFHFFGYVEGVENEWGTFALSELRGVHGVLGLPVERDLYFKPCPSSKITKRSDVADFV